MIPTRECDAVYVCREYARTAYHVGKCDGMSDSRAWREYCQVYDLHLGEVLT